jgi:hypothetical protein
MQNHGDKEIVRFPRHINREVCLGVHTIPAKTASRLKKVRYMHHFPRHHPYVDLAPCSLDSLRCHCSVIGSFKHSISDMAAKRNAGPPGLICCGRLLI